MNPKDIDKLFNDNQHQFDKMPSDKLWERLEEKLDATPSMWEENPQLKKKVHWLRYVAAAAMILVMLIPAIYLMNNVPQGNLAMEQKTIGNAVNPDEYIHSHSESARSIKEKEGGGSLADAETDRSFDDNSFTIEAKKEEKPKNMAANKTTTTKDKLTHTPKPTKSFNNNQQNNRPTSIAKPRPSPVVSAPIPSNKDRSSKTTNSYSPAKPSMNTDVEIAIEEEVMEMEEDAGEILDEVSIIAYKNTQPTTKVATPSVKATFNITDINGIYAYARYNANFYSGSLSNALPFDGYGDERVSQSTLELESAKKVKPTRRASTKKQKSKGKERSNNNISQKRSASKEDESDDKYLQPSAPRSPILLGFLNSLEGNWSLFSNDLTFQETWKSMPNGTLLGTATTLQNGINIFKEDISINPLQGDKMVYTIHHPTNMETLTYQLRTSETSVDNENYLIFDNLQNDFPRTITYRLMNGNDMLKITFEGQKDGKTLFKELILNRF